VAARYDIVAAGENWVTVVASGVADLRGISHGQSKRHGPDERYTESLGKSRKIGRAASRNRAQYFFTAAGESNHRDAQRRIRTIAPGVRNFP
jgi:hypothetical protein